MKSNFFKNKVILVTGGAGFIGSNLCEYFLSLGSKVVCFDNFSTGKKHNINDFTKYKNFKLVEGDIRNYDDCKKASISVDYVLHQAALGSVPRSIEDPITTNSVNISGFLNMLKVSNENKVKRFVYAASSSTYGDSKLSPKKEETIGEPLSPYAITKYVNELYAQNFKKIYNIDTIGLRYFNVFGKKQDPFGSYAAVIPKFILKFINYESPIINGDGSFSRDFTYIKNIIQINSLSLITNDTKSLNQVYNAACENSTSISEMAELIKNYLSKFDKKIKKIKVINGPQRIGDVPHSLASVNKAKTLLGYKITHNFEQGLKESINWYWNNYKNIL